MKHRYLPDGNILIAIFYYTELKIILTNISTENVFSIADDFHQLSPITIMNSKRSQINSFEKNILEQFT